MNSTKKNILNAALKLFNDRGYSNVTIRMIAQKLDMSSGNLNYHYKKREDILEALYFDMVKVFDARIEQLGEKEINLKTVKNDIKTSMKRMICFRFFWTDFYNLVATNERIKAHFSDAYANRKKGSLFLFQLLIEKKLMQTPAYGKEHDYLVEKMIGFGNTWLYTSSLYKTKKLSESYINHQANTLLSFLYPYLTHQGKKQMEELIPDYFK